MLISCPAFAAKGSAVWMARFMLLAQTPWMRSDASHDATRAA
jgi:hypothetical protein